VAARIDGGKRIDRGREVGIGSGAGRTGAEGGENTLLCSHGALLREHIGRNRMNFSGLRSLPKCRQHSRHIGAKHPISPGKVLSRLPS